MKKQKKSIYPVVKYLRELSIVVTGIAITVGTGLLVANSNNKKDLKQYLDAVQLELEANAEQFDWCTHWLQKPVRYANYIRLSDNKFLNNDSLSYYAQTDNNGCGYMYYTSLSSVFATNAFEMLKISGFMRQIKDRELLQTIWGIYSVIESVKNNFDMYFQIKAEEVLKCLQFQTERKPIEVPVHVFHISGLPYEMVRQSRQASERIKETLSKLEEAK